MSNTVTRRELMQLLGATLGLGAVIRAASALDLMPQTQTVNIPVLGQLGNQQRRVVILGAGISGLAAAYELEKAGYQCTVIEASHRPGGRIFTVRSGTLVDEIGNYQTCQFDDEPHMYFNAGAARIPSTHATLLHYCHELNIDLEFFINENKMAWFQDDRMLGGRPIRNGELSTNARGFLAELMHKGLTQSQLDEPFSDTEAEKLLGIIRSFGDLNEDMLYRGSTRAGYASGGFLEHGTQRDLVAFRDLLKSDFIREAVTANEGETGPLLMQPVGGMDMIVRGFLRQLQGQVLYRAPIVSIQVSDNGVEVAYEQDGARHTMAADYCLNCIPSHLVTGIDNNFPPEYLQALKYIRRGEAYKAAFQAKERFWEKEGIYGGITWVNGPSRQIWYPPHGIGKARGVMLGAYDYGGGMYFTKMTHEQRIEAHLAEGEKVHPRYRELVEKGITVAWHRMNHMLGCSARWQRNRGGWTEEELALYHTLQRPVNGRHYMIGDQVTMHSAWQESALLSAHWALRDLDERVQAELATA